MATALWSSKIFRFSVTPSALMTLMHLSILCVGFILRYAAAANMNKWPSANEISCLN